MTITRDLKGYGNSPPEFVWPNGKKVAISFVVNVEEGAELSLADGDERNESIYEAREEVVGAVDPCMTSHFGYGPRRGYWRIIETLEKHSVPATFSTCGRAAARSPWLVQDAVQKGHEVSCHGWRWETHAGMPMEREREVIAKTHAAITEATGVAPTGWHTRSASTVNTRQLLMNHGGFGYDSDAYDDDIPYFADEARKHVILPYAFDTNDMRFQPGGGFIQPQDFTDYCLNAYERLSQEASPSILSIGLHLRIIGRPGRISGLDNLLRQLVQQDDIWFARRNDIALFWRETFGSTE